ncbi:MAG: hypothetical protein EBX52_12880 [Proteobacteria bacterium]|nr:hypothetical protein [Pseudomonadota bacterium]
MNIKAEIIPQDTVVDQVKTLSKQKEELEVQVDVLERKLEAIQASLAENDDFRNRNKELLVQVLKLSEDEWGRRAQLYPDIRLEILTSSAALNAPPKK